MTDVVRLITQDHRQFEKLFDQIKVDRERRAELLDLVAASLAAHSRAEEEEVYPAVAEEAGEREEAGHGTEEHHEAEELLAEVRRLPTDGPEFDAKFKEFVDAINHHVEEEETEILPALGKAVSTKRLEELGVAFAQRRDEVLAFGEDGEKRGASEPSKKELYEQARRMDVSGRSSMTKDELAAVVDRQK